MTISIFARAHESEPWSSIFAGMLSLQPAKRSRPDLDSEHPTTSTSDDRSLLHNTSRRKVPHQNNDRAPKRRKLASQTSTTSPTTRPTPKSRGSTPRPPAVRASLPLPLQRVNTIDRYFTASSSDEQSEQEQPALSVYDAYQKRVHEAEVKSEDKRTLRSHDDGGRLKSELALYFPNYEDVINDVPKEPELLTADTVLIIKDGTGKSATSRSRHDTTNGISTNASSTQLRRSSVASNQASPALGYNGSQIVDFSIIEKSVLHHPQDPLADAVFLKAHKRAERKEKQLRNIERERAMHEKVQLERLLDGLQGHDWLRVMGITGVTDTEAQKYQPKREYFISEVQALVRKFKQWREEEKRLKSEKDAAANRTEDEGDEAEDESDRASREPSSSEIDASAARQLQLEASGSVKPKTKQRPHPPAIPVIYRPPTPQGPFLSFFDKPHLRTAALGKARHGRTILAFGHPIPEGDEAEFELPSDFISPENLKESARRRRRMKRESLVDGASKTL
ncbi:hypothetical protein KVT40_008709 [Elsinoe batatas]|uniref:Something about silencing protein 4 domain-containing protein n=1 Tax=Elsinoe batatas TaxID=2601811 RepID=A0A8K0KW71_9PEZI|nr:hypothetical protein KVT40_008709 [Elsinoe batatas]